MKCVCGIPVCSSSCLGASILQAAEIGSQAQLEGYLSRELILGKLKQGELLKTSQVLRWASLPSPPPQEARAHRHTLQHPVGFP